MRSSNIVVIPVKVSVISIRRQLLSVEWLLWSVAWGILFWPPGSELMRMVIG